jgi:hypothetical protein
MRVHKSFAASLQALSLALGKQEVLVFSENLRNPSVHPYIHTHTVYNMRFSSAFSTERKTKPIAFALSPRDNTLIAELNCNSNFG